MPGKGKKGGKLMNSAGVVATRLCCIAIRGGNVGMDDRAERGGVRRLCDRSKLQAINLWTSSFPKGGCRDEQQTGATGPRTIRTGPHWSQSWQSRKGFRSFGVDLRAEACFGGAGLIRQGLGRQQQVAEAQLAARA